MKRLICTLCALCLIALGYPVQTARAEETVTVLLYMCGADLQSDCLNDINEMCEADVPEWMNVVVEAGGANEWDDNCLPGGEISRFRIADGDAVDFESLNSGNMGDPDTLIEFMDYGLTNYPADRTMLVMWNHGNGATGGICYDETSGDDCLTSDEISYALYENAAAHDGHVWDIIGCDACLMANYELAAQISPYGRFMVASEELEPWLGWNYYGWMSALSENPALSTRDWAGAIADSYLEACMNDNPEDYVCLSVVDLSAMEQLTSAMERFSQYLVQALEAGGLSTFSRGRQQMYSFGEFDDSSSDMVDLKAFVDMFRSIAPNTAAQVDSALENAVSYSVDSGMFDSVCGLSVLLPMETREYVGDYIQTYDYNGVIPNYTDFVKGYTELLNGGSYVFSAAAPEKLDAQTIASETFAGSLAADWLALPASGFTADESEASEAPTPAPSGIFSALAPSIKPSAGTEPIAPNGLPSSYDPDSAYAYSMAVSKDDLENLSYAEGMLMMDIGQGEGYVDLGYTQNTWIDWKNGQVYSLFDGSWPTLDGQLVAMYDQVKTEIMRRSVIPVTVNGEEGYLTVVFSADHPRGVISGFSAGYNDNGLPARGVTKLSAGDVIVPRYTLLYFDDDGETQETDFEGDAITYDGQALEFGYESLEGSDTSYLYCFCLNDIFGDCQYSDFVSFDM